MYSGESKNRLIEHGKQCYVQETKGEMFSHHKLSKMEDRKTSVSHILAICMKRSEEILPEFEEIASVAMAVQNMWLYLSSTKKYGGYWSTPSYSLGTEFSAFLHLDNDEKCLGLFYVGTLKNDFLFPKGVRGDWKEKVEYHF